MGIVKKYYKGLIVAVVLLMSFSIFVLKDTNEELFRKTVFIGQEQVEALIVYRDEDLKRGLSGREFLNDQEGMLFVFPYEDFHGIWMKNMLFPIDIIWIQNGRVVDLKRDARPDTYPYVFMPKEKASHVLEVSAGFVKGHDILIGMPVSF